MALIRIKTIKDVKYYYLVQSVREDGKVKQKIVQYFGTTLPDGYVVPWKASVVGKKAIKKAGTAKTMDKVMPSVLPQTNLPLIPSRGGNHHPLSSRQFILDHLARVGEDYIKGIHKAYKEALDRIAEARGRQVHYHYPVYSSFSQVVWKLLQEGVVEFSGREEASVDPRFRNFKVKPVRKFVRLANR